MDHRLQARLGEAPGFGKCARCPFLASGPVELCYACARCTVQELAALGQRCQVCDRPYDPGETRCHNWLCTSTQRFFSWNFAIAMRSGVLEDALNRYKYQGRRMWAVIFGRILGGFLEDELSTFQRFDLIIPSPTYVGPGGRDFDHTRSG